jgi:hypothetical protein
MPMPSGTFAGSSGWPLRGRPDPEGDPHVQYRQLDQQRQHGLPSGLRMERRQRSYRNIIAVQNQIQDVSGQRPNRVVSATRHGGRR